MSTVDDMNYGFITIGNCQIKFALILCLAFLLLSGGFAYYGKVSGKAQCHRKTWKDIWEKPDIRNQYVISVLAYLLLIPLHGARSVIVARTVLLNQAAAKYLAYEPLLASITLVLALGVLLVRGNPYRYREAVNQLACALFYASMFSSLITGQIQLFRLDNFLWYCALGIAFDLLGRYEVQPTTSQQLSEESVDYFNPVEQFEELYPHHQVQASQIAELISQPSTASLSICVSGAWGSGKTSVVNGAVDKLRQDSAGKYVVIRVNALELDTLSSLFTYLFRQIKRCLKKRGVYVGIGSEYKRFVASAAGTVTDQSLAALLEHKLLSGEDDYREQKKQLEDLLSESLGSDKILVIVDDIERCDADKARQFVFFIKEIATMKNCVALFITDYEHLSQVCAPASGGKNQEYRFYEKFFNYRIDLPDVPLSEMIPYYEKDVYLKAGLRYPEFSKPSEVLVRLDQRFEKKIQDTLQEDSRSRRRTTQEELDAAAQRQKRRHELQNQQRRFHDLLSLPRNLVKFYATMNRYCETINHAFPVEVNSKQRVSTVSYWKKIRLDELLFLMAFMAACLPFESKQLRSRGRMYFETLATEKKPGADQELVLTLSEGLLFEISVFQNNIETTYCQNNALQFVEVFCKSPQEIPRIVNGHTSREGEWFSAIEHGRMEEVESVWLEAANAVLRSNCDAERKLLLWRRLLEFAKENIQQEHWTPDMVLQLFDHSYRNEDWMARDLPFMTCLCTVFQGGALLQNASLESLSRLSLFSERYVHAEMRTFYKLLSYWLPTTESGNSPEKSRLNTAYERLLTTRPEAVQRLDGFLSELSMFSAFWTDPSPGGDVFPRLRSLADSLESFLQQKNLTKYPDVARDIQRMRQSVDELEHFAVLQAKLSENGAAARKFDSRDIDPTNMEPAIRYFETAVHTWDVTDLPSLGQDLSDLFWVIQSKEEAVLDRRQFDRLHQIVTELMEKTGYESMFYRKVLMDYRDRHPELDGEASHPDEELKT